MTKLNSKSAAGILLLALLATLISLAKFQHCRNSGWGAPDVYVHMCYSDLSALYGAREMNVDRWPYESVENSVEYPVVTGLIMWMTALLVDDVDGYRMYFDINAFLIALLFIATVFLLWRLRPELSFLLPAAPAVVASLYINWDIWAVALSLMAIYLFKVGRFNFSALVLGTAIATKFFPITLLLPVALHFARRREWAKLGAYFLLTSVIWLAINLPIALPNPAGWARFFRLNLDRANDLGSIWLAFDQLGFPLYSGKTILIASFLLGLIGITWIYLNRLTKLDEFQAFAMTAFFAIALFVTLSKVYSPQYVLWLTPLAVLAMSSKSDLSRFWIWQGGEALYHLAIWQYLASYSGAKFGLPENIYALTILIRVATLAWFVTSLVKRATPTAALNPQGHLAISG